MRITPRQMVFRASLLLPVSALFWLLATAMLEWARPGGKVIELGPVFPGAKIPRENICLGTQVWKSMPIILMIMSVSKAER